MVTVPECCTPATVFGQVIHRDPAKTLSCVVKNLTGCVVAAVVYEKAWQLKIR